MKKLSLITFIVILIIVFPVLAANNGYGRGQTRSEINEEIDLEDSQELEETEMPLPSVGNQIKNKNQVETKNQGEDSKLQINNQEEESFGERQDEKSSSPSSSLINETVRENRRSVVQKIEELLTDETLMTQEIGQQVKQYAQEQKSVQKEIESELNKVDNRSKLLKTLVGPDYKALKNIQKIIEENQLRIQQLEQLKNQLVNQEEMTKLQEMIQALVNQNIALQNKVDLELKSTSLLGWLFKMFVK